MDYNSLTQQIIQYSRRSDATFTQQVPNLITQGIVRIYSEAKNIGFEVVVNNNLTLNTPILAKPADWKETVSFIITDNRVNPAVNSFLLLRSKDFCQTIWSSPTQTSKPVFYSDSGYGNFYLAPTPNYAYPFQLTYLGLPLFNAENPANFLTQRYPGLLLYSCLLEMVSFLKDDERTPVFESLYNRALQGINQDSKKLYNDRISRRDVT